MYLFREFHEGAPDVESAVIEEVGIHIGAYSSLWVVYFGAVPLMLFVVVFDDLEEDSLVEGEVTE